MRTALPKGFQVLACLAIAFLFLPLLALIWRVPWPRLIKLLATDAIGDALWLSLISSVAAALCALTVGVPLSLYLSRMSGIRASLIRTLVTLPMILPPVVGGAALLFAFGRNGIIGSQLEDLFGVVLPYSLPGVVFANTFVALPFVVLTVESALRSIDRRFLLAASTLGASPRRTILRIELPLIRTSLAAAAFLGWARAIGEFGATITFAGNVPGRTQTLPLAVFMALETDREAALAIRLLFIAGSLGVLVTLRNHWWPSR